MLGEMAIQTHPLTCLCKALLVIQLGHFPDPCCFLEVDVCGRPGRLEDALLLLRGQAWHHMRQPLHYHLDVEMKLLAAADAAFRHRAIQHAPNGPKIRRVHPGTDCGVVVRHI
ncbi:hypothetical protein AVJ23_19555 [Pseudoponticoccus marisrubri]|uniref:Uncharacterized protein n=1 Tax=Pseudoponticoccus marisrubri TaxID=1685382 RepID=A0A0W7WEK8_9RHOB|nr:hypothetical protein AVJ23_19555 [Pseudoponticoccus marisrubri]